MSDLWDELRDAGIEFDQARFTMDLEYRKMLEAELHQWSFNVLKPQPARGVVEIAVPNSPQLPGGDYRSVRLSGKKTWRLISDLLEAARGRLRCPRCHSSGDGDCSLCNPEDLGRRLTVLIDQRGRLTKDIVDKVQTIQALEKQLGTSADPIPMRLVCEICGELHVDQGEFATKRHHTHSCQACGHTWRPAVVATVGVRFLPGFKDPT